MTHPEVPPADPTPPNPSEAASKIEQHPNWRGLLKEAFSKATGLTQIIQALQLTFPKVPESEGEVRQAMMEANKGAQQIFDIVVTDAKGRRLHEEELTDIQGVIDGIPDLPEMAHVKTAFRKVFRQIKVSKGNEKKDAHKKNEEEGSAKNPLATLPGGSEEEPVVGGFEKAPKKPKAAEDSAVPQSAGKQPGAGASAKPAKGAAVENFRNIESISDIIDRLDEKTRAAHQDIVPKLEAIITLFKRAEGLDIRVGDMEKEIAEVTKTLDAVPHLKGAVDFVVKGFTQEALKLENHPDRILEEARGNVRDLKTFIHAFQMEQRHKNLPNATVEKGTLSGRAKEVSDKLERLDVLLKTAKDGKLEEDAQKEAAEIIASIESPNVRHGVMSALEREGVPASIRNAIAVAKAPALEKEPVPAKPAAKEKTPAAEKVEPKAEATLESARDTVQGMLRSLDLVMQNTDSPADRKAFKTIQNLHEQLTLIQAEFRNAEEETRVPKFNKKQTRILATIADEVGILKENIALAFPPKDKAPKASPEAAPKTQAPEKKFLKLTQARTFDELLGVLENIREPRSGAKRLVVDAEIAAVTKIAGIVGDKGDVTDEENRDLVEAVRALEGNKMLHDQVDRIIINTLASNNKKSNAQKPAPQPKAAPAQAKPTAPAPAPIAATAPIEKTPADGSQKIDSLRHQLKTIEDKLRKLDKSETDARQHGDEAERHVRRANRQRRAELLAQQASIEEKIAQQERTAAQNIAVTPIVATPPVEVPKVEPVNAPQEGASKTKREQAQKELSNAIKEQISEIEKEMAVVGERIADIHYKLGKAETAFQKIVSENGVVDSGDVQKIKELKKELAAEEAVFLKLERQHDRATIDLEFYTSKPKKERISNVFKNLPTQTEAEILDAETLTEEEKAARIAACQDFDQLWLALEAIGDIRTPEGIYTTDVVKQMIVDVSEGSTILLESVPENYGLRDKVREFLQLAPEAPQESNGEVLVRSLDEAREKYFGEHKKFMKSEKEKGVKGKLMKWLGISHLNNVSPKSETEIAQNHTELHDSKHAYEAARANLGQHLLNLKTAQLEAGGAGCISEEEIGVLLLEVDAQRPNQTAKFIAEQRARLEAGDLTAEEKDLLVNNFRAGELLQTLVLDERRAQIQQRTETWTPKEKGLLRKALDKTLLAKGKWGRVTRATAGALVFGGVGVATGGVSAGGLLPFMGGKMAKSLLLGSASLGINGVLNKVPVMQDKSEKHYNEKVAIIKKQTGKGNFTLEKADQEIRRAHDEAEKEKRNWLIKRAVTMIALGALAGKGFDELHDLLGGHSEVVGAVAKPVSGRIIEEPAPAEPIDTTLEKAEPQIAIDPVTTWTEPTLNTSTPDASDTEVLALDKIPPADSFGTPKIEGAPVQAPVGPLENAFSPQDLKGWIVGEKGGHNMWTVTKHVLEGTEKFKLLSPEQQDNAIATLYEKFVHMNKEQITEMGIKSGNIHLLKDGEALDLSKALDANGKPVFTGEAIKAAVVNADEKFTTAKGFAIKHQNLAIKQFGLKNPHTLITERIANEAAARAHRNL